MSSRCSLRYWGPAAALLLLAACNRPDLVDPTATPTPRPLSLEEIETAVVATLVAEGQIARPSDTPTPTEEPTATPSDTPEGPTDTPTEVPSCLVVSNTLNLRYGPGLAYAPPLQTLTSGTVLLPFAKNADGSWLEVQLQGESTTGWVSSAGQFVNCNFDPSGLPLGQIPPTPTPTKTLTPTPTLTPSPTNTPCPKFTNATLSARAGSTGVDLTWGTSGGCGPYEGVITVTYEGESDPYAKYEVKASSGKLFDPRRCEGSFTITYTLTLTDSSGQTVTANDTVNVTWIC